MADQTITPEEWAERAALESQFVPGGELNRWANVLYAGKARYLYTNPCLINDIFTQPVAKALAKDQTSLIADFCCGGSNLAQIVSSQLTQSYRRCVRAICVDTFEPSLQKAKAVSPDCKIVGGSLLDLPFHDGLINAATVRMGLSFISKNDQPRALEEIFRVMKPGGVVVVLNDGVFKEDKNLVRAYNEIFAAGGAAQGIWSYREIRRERYFMSFERLRDMAQDVGFQVRDEVDLTHRAIGYISPEIYTKMYRLKGRGSKKISKAFKKAQQKGILPFESGTLRVARPMYSCVLYKG